jgi:DNA invertase Pin-like site-specific DNA recombinase
VFLLTDVAAKGIGFRSLTEAIDTTTSAGRLLAHLLGSPADLFKTAR